MLITRLLGNTDAGVADAVTNAVADTNDVTAGGGGGACADTVLMLMLALLLISVFRK